MSRVGGGGRLRWLVGLAAALLVLAAIGRAWRVWGPSSSTHAVRLGSGTLLLCVWNVENLFDDRDDPGLVDEVEDWMGRAPGVAADKARRVATALLSVGGGRGPDLIGVLEVENRRALEMLRAALNERLDVSDRYDWVVHEESRSGRRIEPAWLGRVRIVGGATSARRRGGSRRIVEAILDAGGGRAHLILSHWTSRRTPDSDDQRAGYARELRARVDALLARDPDAAVLVAGDFNEEPGSPIVRRLTAGTGLVDLMASVDPARRATLVYRGRGYAFDQMLGTRGLVNGRGWRVAAGSAEVLDGPPFRAPVRGDRRPWRYGGPNHVGERGLSDHFPIAVRLMSPAGAAR